MTVEWRILTTALAVFAGVGVLAAGLVLVLGRRISQGTAAARADRLADLRLLPAAAGTIASAIVLLAFVAFEPRWETEEMGVGVPALAGFAALLFAGSVARGFRLIRATRITTRAWLRAGESISLAGISAPAFAVDADFPVVTVIGFVRPRLIIARRVLDACTDEELRAILAHEQGHINRRDNLRRLLICMAPDVIAWLPVSTRWFDDWREAAEDAADDAATMSGADGPLRLAQALLKVARLVPDSQPRPALPASTLYRGERLERRVNRLIGRDAAASSSSIEAPHAGTSPRRLLAAFIVTVSLAMLEQIHGLVERVIHSLP